MSNTNIPWLKPLWTGFDLGFYTSQPLLKVFHSPQAWQRFIEPVWLNAEKVVQADSFDWSQGVLLLMLAVPSSDPQKDLILRQATLADGKVIIKLDIEPDPEARQDLDIEAQLSMIAKGARTVFRPDTPVELEIAGVRGTVTHD